MAATNYTPSILHPSLEVSWTNLNNQTVDTNPRAFTVSPIMARSAVVHAEDTNSDDVYIGPDTSTSIYILTPGASYTIDASGQGFLLSTWFFKSASLNQAIRVIYI